MKYYAVIGGFIHIIVKAKTEAKALKKTRRLAMKLGWDEWFLEGRATGSYDRRALKRRKAAEYATRL